jgi:hypothetical protein
MKKLGIFLFCIFILCTALYAVVQSEIGRNIVRHLITEKLAKLGVDVEIDRIDGTLPSQIDLKGVQIKAKDLKMKIEKIKLRPVLWRFFKGEIAFKDIQAKDISIFEKEPFDFEGKFRASQTRAILQGKLLDSAVTIRFGFKEKLLQFSLKHNLLNAKANATFDSTYQLISSNVQIASEKLISKAKGKLLVDLHITQEEKQKFLANIQWQISNLVVEAKQIGAMQGKGHASLENRKLEAELTLDPFATLRANLEILPQFLLIGTTTLQIENLQSLHIPHIYGKLDAKAAWDLIDQKQGAHIDVVATDFYYDQFHAEKVSLYSDLKNPFSNWTGLIDLELEKAKWHDLKLQTISIETTKNEEMAPFHLFAEGEWTHPLELRLDGFWQNHFLIDMQSLNGTFFNHLFSLVNPVKLEWTETAFHAPKVEISVANATIFADFHKSDEKSLAKLVLKDLPLDFLSLNPLDVPIQGTINLDAKVEEIKQNLKGEFQATTSQTKPMPVVGNFKGSFHQDLLDLKGNLFVHEQPTLDLELKLPIHLSIWPARAKLLTHKNAQGHIRLNGQVEEILDFIDLGPHRLTGQCNCDLHFSNTLYRPLVEGYITFEEGVYENLYTGTYLSNIQADFLAEKNTLYLRTLTAHDLDETGHFKAEGEMHLLQSDLYPFKVDAEFNHLKFVEIDLVKAIANGNLHIEGNTTSALAKGNVEILRSDFTIPDHISRPLPDLQVVYRNPIHPTPTPPQKNYIPYPLYLDLQITGPKAITIRGRGLESEWKGDFHIGGTYTSLAAQGKLELIDGEFTFSSRNFKLTEGSLSLSGVEHEMPELNLAGSMETKGILITARLKGPLDNPQVTLQSSPPLPLGSIMSYLLFGQDVSEIGGFQALQLATSLASLAGTGPDVMESTRKSLGIDRLRVIADPTEEGGETVALQVGKYITKGVLVSFSQGVEDSSPNISVEIEIKDNIVFQIESDQHQEQGKFTLKWHLNY